MLSISRLQDENYILANPEHICFDWWNVNIDRILNLARIGDFTDEQYMILDGMLKTLEVKTHIIRKLNRDKKFNELWEEIQNLINAIFHYSAACTEDLLAASEYEGEEEKKFHANETIVLRHNLMKKITTSIKKDLESGPASVDGQASNEQTSDDIMGKMFFRSSLEFLFGPHDFSKFSNIVSSGESGLTDLMEIKGKSFSMVKKNLESALKMMLESRIKTISETRKPVIYKDLGSFLYPPRLFFRIRYQAYSVFDGEVVGQRVYHSKILPGEKLRDVLEKVFKQKDTEANVKTVVLSNSKQAVENLQQTITESDSITEAKSKEYGEYLTDKTHMEAGAKGGARNAIFNVEANFGWSNDKESGKTLKENANTQKMVSRGAEAIRAQANTVNESETVSIVTHSTSETESTDRSLKEVEIVNKNEDGIIYTEIRQTMNRYMVYLCVDAIELVMSNGLKIHKFNLKDIDQLKPYISEDIFEQVKKEIETFSIIDIEKKEILIKDARSFINEDSDTKELIPYAIPVSAFPLYLNTDVTIEEGYIVKRDGTKVIGNVMDEYAVDRYLEGTRKLKMNNDALQGDIEAFKSLTKIIEDSKDPEKAVHMTIGRFSKSDALVKMHLLNVGSSENALSRIASPDLINEKE